MKNNVIVPHAEVLVYAIEHLQEKQREWDQRCEQVKQSDPNMAKELADRSPWKAQIDVLSTMYKLETGETYS